MEDSRVLQPACLNPLFPHHKSHQAFPRFKPSNDFLVNTSLCWCDRVRLFKPSSAWSDCHFNNNQNSRSVRELREKNLNRNRRIFQSEEWKPPCIASVRWRDYSGSKSQKSWVNSFILESLSLTHFIVIREKISHTKSLWLQPPELF